MADYIEITDAGGTKRKVSVDEIESQFVQRQKMQIGKDGEAKDVSAENPMPIGELPAGTKAIGQVDPRGNKAHDEADAGNPVKVGARARTALPAAVSQDDRTDNISDKFGRQLITVAPLDERVSATLNRTVTEAGQLLAALSEGAYVVTAIKVINAHATVGTKVEILDGETVKDKGYAGVLGGGWTLADPNGLFVCTKNTKLNGKCVTTGADVDITVSAYKIPA